ncbi:FG-GAP-like repeat-containing protein [Congregibacter litoralis]|nr:FG-GAP-like repeat-containing protein [Congregibacter litoralis]
MAKLLASCFTTAVFSLSALANTPPSLSTVSNSPEAPLGNRYFGGAAGQATVSAGGNAVYQLPIELPPGTGESTPSLRLVYNSNVDNGLLGLGWFLQGADSKITRCAQTVAQDGARRAVNFTYEDRFCLNGNRLVVTSGTYGQAGSEYRTESDQFSRVIAHGTTGNGPSHFTIETKSGHLQEFGNTTDSAVENETGTHIRLWRLNRDEDRVGNYFTMAYHEDTVLGESYPTKIEYSGNDDAGISPNASIDFEYEARPDNTVSFQAGSTLHKHPKRLTGISIKVAGTVVYRYELSYTENGLGSLSRLDSVQRCDDAGSCQDPLTINWVYAGTGDTYTPTWMETLTYRGQSYGEWDTRASRQTPYGVYNRWHDFNGDGQDDYIIWDPTRANSQSRNEFDLRLSGPNGYTTETWYASEPVDRLLVSGESRLHWADVNGDGRTDMIYVKPVGGASSGTLELHVSLATDTGFSSSLYSTVPSRGYPGKNSVFFADMNGDAKVDLVTVSEV